MNDRPPAPRTPSDPEGASRGLRAIMHVDMDAFFAAIEQHDKPAYRGQPLIVGASPDRRGVVAACSYEARTFGIHSAMPSAEAGRRCPHAIFVPVNMTRYLEVSRRVFDLFERFSPFIEPLSVDEAFIDMTGSAHLFGGLEPAANKLKRLVRQETGLTCSIGLATNKFLAKIASEMNKPDGITHVPADHAAAFLAPLSVRTIWGVGKTTATRLEQAGLVTIADLQQATPHFLRILLGEHAAERLEQLAFGIDPRPIETHTEEKSMSRETTFDRDQPDAQAVYHELLHLVDAVAARLRQAGKYAGGIQIKLRWADFQTITRRSTLDRQTADVFQLMDAARVLFERIPLNRPVRLIGFGVHKLSRQTHRATDLFSDREHDERRERATAALDRIRAKYGPASIRLGY